MEDIPNKARDMQIFNLGSLIRWTRQEGGMSLGDFAELIKEHFDKAEREVLCSHLLDNEEDNG